MPPSGGETDWRWIGIRYASATQCPAPPIASGWTVEPLFGSSENRELKRFCLYQRSVAASPAPLFALPLVRLDRDVMGVSGQGSELADESWRALEAHFLSQVGQVALPVGPAADVRLSVVDTSPNGSAVGALGPEDRPANSPHGTALLNMARDLLCDATEVDCRATVGSRLAMAWVCFDPMRAGVCRDATEGGYVGLIGELAQAIRAEVHQFAGGGGKRLVINLSLGWHRSFGGAEAGIAAMPTPAQAVYRALEDAVCRGALPIAAAGNRDASSTPDSGPLLPAAWEARGAPKPTDCRALGVPAAPGLSGPATYRPLVFSVAGLDAAGEPLSTARPAGSPPLGAFADHAVVALAAGRPTGTLTGSSVSALVTSAAAAAVWSYRPGADAFQVMAELYSSAASLGRAPDYHLGQGAAGWQEVRSVDVCEAVAAACNAGGTCAAPLCGPAAALDLTGVDLRAFATVQQFDMSGVDDDLYTSACGAERVLYDETRTEPAYPCPHLLLDGATHRPWAQPQPPSVPCPNCMDLFASPGNLYFEVDDQWLGTLSDFTLRCGGVSYALDLGTLQAGDQVRVTQVPVHCSTDTPTFLSFVHNGQRGVLSPLVVCDGC